MRCIASPNTMPMIACRVRDLNSKSTKKSTTQASGPSGMNAQWLLRYRNGPSRYSTSITRSASPVAGRRVTRLAKRSRNTLNEITRSASITSPPGAPSSSRRLRMRAA